MCTKLNISTHNKQEVGLLNQKHQQVEADVYDILLPDSKPNLAETAFGLLS